MNTEDRRTSERHGKQENIMVLLPLPSPPLTLSLCLLMESFRTARSVAFHPFPKVISRGASVIIQNRMASLHTSRNQGSDESVQGHLGALLITLAVYSTIFVHSVAMRWNEIFAVVLGGKKHVSASFDRP